MISFTRRRLLPVVAIGTLLLCVSLATGRDFVKNRGFERVKNGFPAHWRGNPGVYGSSTTAHSGKRSLHYSNDDPDVYRLCTQDIPLKPGRVYRVSAWIKTRNVQGEGGGATLCVEWKNDGEHMGGSYPSGLTGTNGWTHWEHRMQTIPEEADSAHIVCYVRRGMTGEAWFDDIKIEQVKRPPLDVTLLRPGYRGWLYDGWPASLKLQAAVNTTDYDYSVEDIRLRVRLSSTNGETLVSREYELEETNKDIQVGRPEMEPGRYRLKVTLVRKDGAEAVGTAVRELRCWPGNTPDARCWIDRHRRLVVDGEPFFPLGMYASLPDKEDLQRLTNAGFNCVMPYGLPHQSLKKIEDYLDCAQKEGIKTIFSTKDLYEGTKWFPEGGVGPWKEEKEMLKGLVRRFRDHPNVIAWYLNDEKPLSMYDRLRMHQRVTHRLDPDHPTWVVLYQVRDVRQYLGTFDVIGTDPYPIEESAEDIEEAGEWTRITSRQVYGARPLWMVPQAFNWDAARDEGEHRPPTYREMRNMAFQCLCEGAHGLVFYAYQSLKKDPDAGFRERWKDVRRVASELSRLKPVFLSVQEPPDIEVKTEEALSLLKKHDDRTYLFLVNPQPSAAAHAQVKLPRKPRKITIDGEEPEGRRKRSMSMQMKPLAVRIVRLRFGRGTSARSGR